LTDIACGPFIPHDSENEIFDPAKFQHLMFKYLSRREVVCDFCNADAQGQH
jgi:hypothetical protein